MFQVLLGNESYQSLNSRHTGGSFLLNLYFLYYK